MTIHAYTSFSYSYLNRARVFARSLREQHPDWVIWAVLTDKAPQGYKLDWTMEDFDRLISAEELFGAETDRWLFGHDIVEACTAVKGRAMQHIMDEEDVEKIFYFDPDIALFNSMEPVVDALDRYSIVLTPHQIDPDPAEDKTAIRDNEITSLDYGVFNLGFIAVRNGAEARRFANWWAARLDDWCHDRLEIGVFVDQKWCNFIPCFFDDVLVLRDPGYNVASWNLSQRRIEFNSDGVIQVNNNPLRFYHFTKLGPVGATMTYRYAKGRTEVFELWWWYNTSVQKATDPNLTPGWWHYASFSDGTSIPKAVRELYREREDLKKTFPDPFSVGPGSFKSWVQSHTKLLEL